jgi:hypothetical protein
LVLYELFERKLPVYDQMKQTVTLPPYYQSRSVIKPCLNEIPEQRPTAGTVVKVLDRLIRNILSNVRTLLPESEQEKLRIEASMISTDGKDALEIELVQLYRKLLSESPAQVDLLISKGFQINLDYSPSGLSYDASPAYIPANIAYVPAQGYVPMIPSQYPGFHYPQPAANPSAAPPPYPAGARKPPSSSAPPPAYPAGNSGNHEVYGYLDQLNVSELKTVLAKCNIVETGLNTRHDLIEKIKKNCTPQQLTEIFKK